MALERVSEALCIPSRISTRIPTVLRLGTRTSTMSWANRCPCLTPHLTSGPAATAVQPTVFFQNATTAPRTLTDLPSSPADTILVKTHRRLVLISLTINDIMVCTTLLKDSSSSSSTFPLYVPLARYG